MLSVGRILEGAFGLVRERFVAVAVWAGIYLAGNLAVIAVMMPILQGTVGSGIPVGDSSAMLAAMGPVWLLNLLLALIGLILYAAAMRAVLRPEASGLGFLRLGMDELRLLALVILFIVASLVLGVGLMLLLGMFGAGVAMTSDSPLVAGLVGVVASIVALGLFIFFVVRFSLAFPLTLHRRRIVIGEAWSLSRGRFWTLFGAAFVVTLIGMVLTLALSTFMMGSYFADLFAAAGDPEATMLAAEAQSESLTQFGPMMIVQSLAGAVIAGLWVALSGGSIATAAKLLLADELDDAEDVFG